MGSELFAEIVGWKVLLVDLIVEVVEYLHL